LPTLLYYDTLDAATRVSGF